MIYLNVLVIGGSRFTGRFVVEELIQLEHSVTVLNRGVSDKKIDAPYLSSEKYLYPKEVSLIHCDRTHSDELINHISNKNFEAVIDTCAYNENHIQAILDSKLEKLENYLFISTASVYDDKEIDIFPITENATIGSSGDDFPVQYTRDKRRAEERLKKAFSENNFPMTIIRPTYIYGPYSPLTTMCPAG